MEGSWSTLFSNFGSFATCSTRLGFPQKGFVEPRAGSGLLRPTFLAYFSVLLLHHNQPKRLQRQGHGRYYLRDFWATVKESSPKQGKIHAWHHRLNGFDPKLLRSAAGESGFSPATLSESAWGLGKSTVFPIKAIHHEGLTSQRKIKKVSKRPAQTWSQAAVRVTSTNEKNGETKCFLKISLKVGIILKACRKQTYTSHIHHIYITYTHIYIYTSHIHHIYITYTSYIHHIPPKKEVKYDPTMIQTTVEILDWRPQSSSWKYFYRGRSTRTTERTQRFHVQIESWQKEWVISWTHWEYWDKLRYIEIYWDILRYIEIYWDILRLRDWESICHWNKNETDWHWLTD